MVAPERQYEAEAAPRRQESVRSRFGRRGMTGYWLDRLCESADAALRSNPAAMACGRPQRNTLVWRTLIGPLACLVLVTAHAKLPDTQMSMIGTQETVRRLSDGAQVRRSGGENPRI